MSSVEKRVLSSGRATDQDQFGQSCRRRRRRRGFRTVSSRRATWACLLSPSHVSRCSSLATLLVNLATTKPEQRPRPKRKCGDVHDDAWPACPSPQFYRSGAPPNQNQTNHESLRQCDGVIGRRSAVTTIANGSGIDSRSPHIGVSSPEQD